MPVSDPVDIGGIAEETGVDPVDIYAVIRALVNDDWFAWRYVRGDDEFAAAQDAWTERRRQEVTGR